MIKKQTTPDTLIPQIIIVSLTMQHDTELMKTISSTSNFTLMNTGIRFLHYIVCPEETLKVTYIKYEHINYEILFLKDPGIGIYKGFNLAISKSCNDSYIIFLSAGDTFNEKLKIDTSLLTKKYALIAYGTNIRSDQSNFQYLPKLSGYLRNTLPHSALFTRVQNIKRIGNFPTDLGSAADFYVTAKIIKDKKNTVYLSNEIISTFYLGGISSSFKSIKHYYNALNKLELNNIHKIYLIIRKLISYIKYK